VRDARDLPETGARHELVAFRFAFDRIVLVDEDARGARELSGVARRHASTVVEIACAAAFARRQRGRAFDAGPEHYFRARFRWCVHSACTSERQREHVHGPAHEKSRYLDQQNGSAKLVSRANNSAPQSMMLSTVTHGTPAYETALAQLSARGEIDFARVESVVREIVADVKKGGDAAVTKWIEKVEKRAVPRTLVKRDWSGKEALARLPKEAREALEEAADRIASFHRREREMLSTFTYEEEGVSLGLRVRPLARVGVYAPGGKARYPSSVLMAAIPAKVAGVEEIILATPLAGDASDDVVLAAAQLAGVTTIVDCGGAQAIAALAFGTESVPRVDKIVGPGNAYVACAKRLVYGAVDIDSIAGPSEILVLADGSANPKHVAADLLSQAEHDEDAYAMLVTTSAEMAAAVAGEVETQLADLPRASIARESLRRHGLLMIVPDRLTMASVANGIAAEHLSLQVESPDLLLDAVSHAGAAFVGSLTPEAAGDYVAGPSHVLPTGGAVRFGSPLGVHDFIARTSIIRYGAEALAKQASTICTLARLEGLEGHARAVLVRVPPDACRG
jgi:histidinol dehydrogenase